ncbi:hypothetical protein JCM3766R1_000445 [Sporobolomyces carnicolor]
MEADSHTLSTGRLSLGLNSRGLTFHSLVVTGSTTRDVLVGFEDQESYRERLFFGSTVGRYANRLPAGKTVLKTGAEISLNGPDSVCLHGGDSGFDTLPWTLINRPDSNLFPLDDPEHPVPEPPSDPRAPVTHASAMFRLYSPSGNDGFPCTLETEALVVVQEDETGAESVGQEKKSLGKVKVVLRSRIKEDGDQDIDKGTPVNLTVHWGFRLDDCHDADILNHELYIDSTELVHLDDKGLATGKIDQIPQDGAGFDYHSKKQRKIGDSYPEGGIDRNFLLTPRPTSPPTPISSEPQLVLTSPRATKDDSRFELEFKTSLASVQIYSAPGLDGSGPIKKRAHGGERGYDRDGALFIEFQQPVGTIVHTAAAAAEANGNELAQWLSDRVERLSLDREAKSWERDSLLRRGQVWESWVEVDVKEFSS